MPGQWCNNNYCYKPQLTTQGTTDHNAFSQAMDNVDTRLGQLDTWQGQIVSWKNQVDGHIGRHATLGDPGYSTLSEALTTIGSNNRTLVIPAGTVNITSNTTIPANVHLVVLRGGVFNISNGVTLTIYGPITAGRYQIFSWSGTGTLAGSPRIEHAFPEWFGAVGNGSTDDYAAVDKCLAVAQVWLVPVKFRPAVYKINTKLTPIDFTKTKLNGTPGTVLDFSGLTTSGIDQFAIHLYSSADYTSGYKNRVLALSDMALIGSFNSGSLKNHVGLCIGHSTYTGNCELLIDRIMFQGFKYNVRMISNTYLITFNDCMLRWGALYVGTDVTNFGSQLRFNNFFFESGAGEITQLGVGNYYFENCYFDNHWVRINGDVSVCLRHCLWENSGSTGTSGYWLEIASTSAHVLMEGNKIYLNNPGANYTTALFKIADNCVDRGMHIRDLWLPSPWTYYTPEVNDTRRTLVAGKGRVTAEGISAWHSGGYIVPVAYYPNVIYNGGFELNNFNGWTGSGTGTASIDSATKKVGSYAAKIVCTAGQSYSLTQSFRVRPGQMVLGSWWHKLTLSGGTGVSARFYFYNEKGDNVTTDELHGDQSDWRQYTSTFDWAVAQFRAFVPRSAVKCTVEFYVEGGSGTTTYWLDEMVINVC